MTDNTPLAIRIETAIGGEYAMPDGREFWIDAPVAGEMTRRVVASISNEATDHCPCGGYWSRHAVCQSCGGDA